MANALQKYVEAASGLTALTRARAEQIVKQLAKQGGGVASSASDLVEDLLERSKGNRDAIAAMVKAETGRAVKALGLASRKDVERLQKQLADLRAAAKAVPAKVAKKAPAKKSTATTKSTATKKKTTKKSS